MGTPTDRFVRLLTSHHRVILLGGLAVIGHGLSRSTYDGDIWLEPMVNAETWSAELDRCCRNFGELTLHRLPGWTPVSGDEIITAVMETGIIRILGLDCPLDAFRVPNEIEAEDFDAMYSRGTVRSDGSMLPDPLDLLQSKMNTGRDRHRPFRIRRQTNLPGAAPTRDLRKGSSHARALLRMAGPPSRP